MRNCSECSDIFLDYLYGLLDEAEAASLREHVEGCANCQEGLAQARQQQSLFARAALQCRAIPPFQAPAMESAPSAAQVWLAVETKETGPDQPRTIPIPPRPWGAWRRWLAVGAAAALLLTVGTVYAGYLSGLQARQLALAEARTKVESIDGKLAVLSRGLERDLAESTDKIKGQFLQVQVVGPATYQNTATNPYRITTQTPANKLAAAQVHVKLINRFGGGKADAELFSKTLESQGELRFDLPANLGVKPGDSPNLVIETQTAQAKQVIEQQLQVQEEEFLTHIALNKSTFRPGETVLFRTLTLERFGLTPVNRPMTLACTLYRIGLGNQELTAVMDLRCVTQAGGIAGGEFVVTPNLAVGEYLFVVAEASAGKDKGSFIRPASRQLRVEPSPQKLSVDKDAMADKNVPAPGANLNANVEFFPEGGDLVESPAQRVYFRLHFPLGTPKAVEAVLEDSKQQEVLKVDLSDAGIGRDQVLGSMSFAPRFGELYRLRLTAGGKLLDRWPLPKVLASGLTLNVPRAVLEAGEPIKAEINNPARQPLLVLLNCRGRTVDQKIVESPDKLLQIVLEPPTTAHGVMRLTVYEKEGDDWKPAAERLIYRQPAAYLNLAAVFDKDQGKGYKPGDKVTLGIEARIEKDASTPTWLHALVIDEKSLQPGDSPEPSVPAYFLVTSELRGAEDLEDANFMLAKGPAAAKALDLLLGTQGWRRFVPQGDAKPSNLVAKREQGQHAQLALFSAQTADPLGGYANSLKTRHQELTQDNARRRADLQLERHNAESAARTAAAALAEYQERPAAWLRYGAGGTVLLLLIAGAILLLFGLAVALRRQSSPRALLAGSCLTLLMAVVFFASTSSLRIGDDSGAARTLLTWLRPTEAESPEVVLAMEVAKSKKDLAMGDVGQLRNQLFAAEKNEFEGARVEDLARDGVKRAEDRARIQVAGGAFGAPAAKGGAGGFGGGAKGGAGKGGAKKAEPPTSKDAKADALKPLLQGLPGANFKVGPEAANQLQQNAEFRQYANSFNQPGLGQQGVMLWQPALFAPQGNVSIGFDLPFQPSSFHFVIYGHTADGRLGVVRGTMPSGK